VSSELKTKENLLPGDGSEKMEQLARVLFNIYNPFMIENLLWSDYLIAWIGAFAAGFMDSMAGGGGLIILPLLLALGLPPHVALGTNKLQGSFGTFTAAVKYRNSGLFSFREMIPGILSTFTGAALGSWLAARSSAGFLAWLVPVLLTGVFIYTLIGPQVGEEERKSQIPEVHFLLFAGLLLGFYDGFFGPGTGSFWTMGFILLLGWNFRRATGATKVVNFTSNITALGLFLMAGNVHIKLGLTMAVFQIAGALVGSHVVIKGSLRRIRIIFLSVVGLTLIKLFSDLLRS